MMPITIPLNVAPVRLSPINPSNDPKYDPHASSAFRFSFIASPSFLVPYYQTPIYVRMSTIPNWAKIRNQLAIRFEGRFPL